VRKKNPSIVIIELQVVWLILKLRFGAQKFVFEVVGKNLTTTNFNPCKVSHFLQKKIAGDFIMYHQQGSDK